MLTISLSYPLFSVQVSKELSRLSPLLDLVGQLEGAKKEAADLSLLMEDEDPDMRALAKVGHIIS